MMDMMYVKKEDGKSSTCGTMDYDRMIIDRRMYVSGRGIQCTCCGGLEESIHFMDL